MSLIILIFFIFVLINYKTTVAASYNAFVVWITTIFPSMYVSFVLSDTLADTNISKRISKIFYPLFRLIFKIKYEASAFIIFLSFFIGNPGSSKIIKKYLDERIIDSEEANHLIKFSTFLSPLYLLTISSIVLKGNYVLVFLLTQYLGGILYGIIISWNYNKEKITINMEKDKPKNILESFTNSITNNVYIQLSILGISVFFSALIAIISIYLGTYKALLLNIFIEIISANNLIDNTSMHLISKGVLLAFSCSFSGLSIHLQIKTIFQELEYIKFLKSKILCGLSSALLFYVLSSIDQSRVIFSYELIIPLIVSLVFLVFIILYELIAQKKISKNLEF